MMGVAAVAAGNLPHQRQPQPHNAGLLGMAVHPIEGLEDAFARRLGHPGPAIQRLDAQPVGDFAGQGLLPGPGMIDPGITVPGTAEVRVGLRATHRHRPRLPRQAQQHRLIALRLIAPGVFQQVAQQPAQQARIAGHGRVGSA